MIPQPLFDVVIHVAGDNDTGQVGPFDVSIIDRYHKRGDIIGAHQADTLDDAIRFAKGAVNEFTRGVQR